GLAVYVFCGLGRAWLPQRVQPDINHGNQRPRVLKRRVACRRLIMAVGVFDSGLGGLTVLAAIAARMPDLPLVYLGDNAHAPYGVRDADDIFNLTCAGVERLWAEGCDLVILACNTASAAALKRMQETWLPSDKRVLGVFVPMIEALTERGWGDNSPPREVAVKHVALFATPATVASRAFQRELAFRAIGVDVE